jgi:choline kinase
MIRQAVIPAAGRGVRLDRPQTPKPLVDVGGQPIAVRLIHQLIDVGVTKIVIILGHDGEKIRKALSKYDFAASMEFIYNPDWETGLPQSILAAENFIDGPFLLAMADHVFDQEIIAQMADYPIETGWAAAAVDERVNEVFALETAVKVTVKDGVVSAMSRELLDYNAVDMGLFVFLPSIFDELRSRITPGRENELSVALSPSVAQGRIAALSAKGRVFDDVDTPAALVHCEMRLRREHRQSRTVRAAALLPAKRDIARFDYRIDSPKTTEMVVGRGFVADPSRLDLVPDSAASSPIFVFTDEIVNGLYGREFVRKMTAIGYDVHCIVLPVGEEAKSLTSYAFLVERVLTKGVDERSVFISLGGGVVCNVCGFVASTIYRGLDLVHLPTTLMSQCDAAISHKQGINGYQGKNLVGTYYSPRLVAVDVDTLSTLPDRLIADGMSEVIKHALGQDPSYTDMLLTYNGSMRDPNFLESVIKRNVGLKCDLAIHGRTCSRASHRVFTLSRRGRGSGHGSGRPGFTAARRMQRRAGFAA